MIPGLPAGRSLSPVPRMPPADGRYGVRGGNTPQSRPMRGHPGTHAPSGHGRALLVRFAADVPARAGGECLVCCFSLTRSTGSFTGPRFVHGFEREIFEILMPTSRPVFHSAHDRSRYLTGGAPSGRHDRWGDARLARNAKPSINSAQWPCGKSSTTWRARRLLQDGSIKFALVSAAAAAVVAIAAIVASIPNIGFMSKSFLARDTRPGTLLSGLLAGRRGRHHIRLAAHAAPPLRRM